jgi:ribosomal protein S18 acetylase RimI-like enzyme
MPGVTDPSEIRALLENDRNWAVYALGDLDPGRFQHSTFFGIAGIPALVLLYRAFETPVLLTLGKPGDVQLILKEVDLPPNMYLHIRPEILPLVQARYHVLNEKTMCRMILERHLPQLNPAKVAIRLGPEDFHDLERLYEDGVLADESPGFFSQAMLQEGVYFGVREGHHLIAVAGTHLVSLAESVAAIGNVYTRRDRRNLGMASCVTGAVARGLVQAGIRTIALNVEQTNDRAIRVYQKLGFVSYCGFKEGLATITAIAHRAG